MIENTTELKEVETPNVLDYEEFDIHTHIGNLYDDTDEIMTLNLPETCKYFDLEDETLNFYKFATYQL